MQRMGHCYSRLYFDESFSAGECDPTAVMHVLLGTSTGLDGPALG